MEEKTDTFVLPASDKNMDDTSSLGDFVSQHYNQNRLYDFEEDNKSDIADENKSVSDALSQRRNTQLCLKNLPHHLKDNGLRNLCGQYGHIKHVVYWSDRNYAFVTYASLSEAENAIRKINDNNTLGIKADFAFETKKKKNDPYEDLLELMQTPSYDTDINWSERTVKGPFSHPQRVPDALIKMKDRATTEDYENGDLAKADPFKEFIHQLRNNNSADFVGLKRRIINGRSVLIKNDNLLQTILEKSKLSSGCYDKLKATYSFRNVLLPDPLALISSCSKCKGPSNQYCRNCDAPFCSIICEANDEIHKETCANGKIFELSDAIDMVALQDDETVVELSTKWIRKSNTQVKLTSFIDFKTVYVRPSNSEDELEFIKLMNDVAKAAKTSVKLKVPKSGLLALALFDAVYHRALILKLLNQNEAIVAFIDFGNVDTVNIADLRIMPTELKKRPRMVTKFTLKDVPDAMCNDGALNILFELLNKSAEVTIRFDEPYVPGATECELATAAFDSVNLVIKNTNVPFYEVDELEQLHHVKITGQNVSVLILENFSLRYNQLSVIRSADIDLFQRNHQHIQKIANYLDRDGERITPRNLQYCLAKDIDNQWYRVQAIEVKYDGHVTAIFVDYGNINILKINCFRRIPSVLMFPCITATVTCFNTDATPAVEAKRKELLPNMSEVTFLELTDKSNNSDNEYDDNCVCGTLAPNIYEQADKCSEQLNDATV